MLRKDDVRCKINLQLDSFNNAKGLSGIATPKTARDKRGKKTHVKWYDSYRNECLEL